MTTNVQTMFSPDVFLDKSVILLEKSAFPEDFHSAAAEWTIKNEKSNSLLEILKLVYDLAFKNLTNYDFYIITGSSTWQDPSRIVRYRGLFGSLKFRGIDFTNNPDSNEAEIENNGKIKFFGFAKISRINIDLIPKIMDAGSCTYIVAKNINSDWYPPISTGWSGKIGEDSHLITNTIKNKGILFRRIGFFDDKDVGIQALGPLEILKKLMLTGE